MIIKVVDRFGRVPKFLTHAIFVDDVIVGYGCEKSLNKVANKLISDNEMASALKNDFMHITEEW